MQKVRSSETSTHFSRKYLLLYLDVTNGALHSRWMSELRYDACTRTYCTHSRGSRVPVLCSTCLHLSTQQNASRQQGTLVTPLTATQMVPYLKIRGAGAIRSQLKRTKAAGATAHCRNTDRHEMNCSLCASDRLPVSHTVQMYMVYMKNWNYMSTEEAVV
jgi:hypothetical protein